MAFAPTAAQVVWNLGEDREEGLRLCQYKVYLETGVWCMRGVPGKQGPMGNKTL
jgi:hypothetical protein